MRGFCRTTTWIGALALALISAVCPDASTGQSHANPASTGWAIEIHGGAGEAEWLNMDKSTAEAYRRSLTLAVEAGAAILQKKGTAVDAVQAAVEVLEDDPLFNAGRGSAFAADGTIEMDASIMDGIGLKGAGVASIHFTRHPIALARAVMDNTPYVLMVGAGADAFSKSQGLEQQPQSFFFTEMRWREFEQVMRKSNRPIPPLPAGVQLSSGPTGPKGISSTKSGEVTFSHRFGTVGAVARDTSGHLAAATSTGGMQGKLPGRVGDSPILGAGTYADDRGCAISGTGVGEYFIRLSLAHSINALCSAGESPTRAADHLIHQVLPELAGGEGGVIVISRTGAPIWSNNTLGMFHARQLEGSQPEVWIK